MRLALLLAVSVLGPFTACGGSQPSAATPAGTASASSTATDPGGLAPEDEVPAQPPSSPKDHCASPPCG